MPTVEVLGDYRIEMHTGRESPPPHVHVVHADGDVVVNLLTLSPYGIQSFRLPRSVKDYLRGNQESLLDLWDSYHG